jgi:hypothetical protein
MRQRNPRQKEDGHLKFIRGLPCLTCGDDTSTEAAHVRMPDFCVAKPLTGLAIKPDDKYTVPLCGKCHRSQHQTSERVWWLSHSIDPVKIALALYSVSGDHAAGEQIVMANV